MIALLRGTIHSKRPDGLVVEVGGVGYHVSIPLCSLCSIPGPGEEVFLHTYTHVREDALQLYGFLTEEERKVFVSLLRISGIGPKLGLAILSGMPVQSFLHAVMHEDVELLSSIPGLGKKTASRLILEMKEKLPDTEGDSAGPVKGDAVSALVNLGYKKAVSAKAVDAAMKKGADSMETVIREALKVLTGNT